MDKVGFLAANAAAAAMSRQENIANNLANVNTSGFRAQVVALRSTPLVALTPSGEARLDTRTFATETVTGYDARPGVMQQTGRDLDIAVSTPGWLVVQRANGAEGYTRAGSLVVNNAGVLVNTDGLPVLGEGGALEIPEGARVQISDTGLVSVRNGNGNNVALQDIGQLRLVNPEANTLERAPDGYFQPKAGAVAPEQAQNVRLRAGYLEGSNVNPAEAIVEMIAAQRTFDVSMKTVSMTKESDQKADSLLQFN
ncbi:flagellar basal body rod protein FlgF [Limnobacter humi]|uniref:Flagellar basal-body rod protein FlgF n=1 Tax=Limnobacter humi TaxID=1778671 RepID=A0ABT1WJ40_9BURK|nr:flagellar basal body rod protein FlgF [Limnobacter humi]MCQ8897542.1 flagellar basal body rod protein FlgF [Limnobacter humi]